MNIRCPNCGAVHSLDTLINDADASAVLKAVLDMDAALGKAAIRYIGLFRPAKSQLSWSRTAKLLNELMPMIKAETVERDGVSYPAPAAAWIHGFAADAGTKAGKFVEYPLRGKKLLALTDEADGKVIVQPLNCIIDLSKVADADIKTATTNKTLDALKKEGDAYGIVYQGTPAA